MIVVASLMLCVHCITHASPKIPWFRECGSLCVLLFAQIAQGCPCRACHSKPAHGFPW